MDNLIHAREARHNATVLWEDRVLQEVGKLIKETSLRGLTELSISVTEFDIKDPDVIVLKLKGKGYCVYKSYLLNGDDSFINVRW